jgi:hypothetical protein
MEPRERQHSDSEQSGGGGPSGTPTGANLDPIRQRASQLLAAGSAIIQSSLSGNSQAYLAANRQQGGE